MADDQSRLNAASQERLERRQRQQLHTNAQETQNAENQARTKQKPSVGEILTEQERLKGL